MSVQRQSGHWGELGKKAINVTVKLISGSHDTAGGEV